MKKILIIIAIIALPVSCSHAAGIYVSQELGCTFDFPEKWSLDTSQVDRITVLYDENRSAFISIKRYTIDRSNQIQSDGDLAEAIRGLYSELGIVPEEKDEQDFYIRSGRAIFETQYTADDEIEKVTYNNFLKGIIVRLDNGRQVLYLMMAVASEKIYEQVQPDFEQVINSFQVTAVTSEKLYSRTDITPYLLIFLIFMLTAFFFTRNRRVQKSRNPFGRSSNSFWRCSSCRLVNHIDHLYCTRCGRARTEANKILR